jgi:hypothetical protein
MLFDLIPQTVEDLVSHADNDEVSMYAKGTSHQGLHV